PRTWPTLDRGPARRKVAKGECDVDTSKRGRALRPCVLPPQKGGGGARPDPGERRSLHRQQGEDERPPDRRPRARREPDPPDRLCELDRPRDRPRPRPRGPEGLAEVSMFGHGVNARDRTRPA